MIKNIIVSFVVSILVGVGISAYVLGHTSNAPAAGADISTQVGVSNFTEVGQGDQVEAWRKVAINAGEQYATVLNSTGAPIFVDYAEATTDGIASSTFRLISATTSAPTNLPTYSLPTSTPKLINFTLGTSTEATTTSSVTSARNGTLRVANGEYVYLLLENGFGDARCAGAGYGNSVGGIQNGACESATSTNRGFNITLKMHYHRDIPNN